MISGIPAAPAGIEKINVTFSIEENGILTVTAESLSNRRARSEIAINNVCGSLTKAEIERMVIEAELYREQDREREKICTARLDLEQYCIDVKNRSGAGKSVVVEKCNEILSWLNNVRRPTISQFVQWKDTLKSLLRISQEAKKRNHEADENDEDDVKIIVKKERAIVIDD